MSVFALSTKEKIDDLIRYCRACYELNEDDLTSIEALLEVAELARWILAHASEDGGMVRLRITMNNPNSLPVEELFLRAARHNTLGATVDRPAGT